MQALVPPWPAVPDAGRVTRARSVSDRPTTRRFSMGPAVYGRGFAHGAMESDLSDGRPHAVLLVDEGVERSRFVKGADPVEGPFQLRLGHHRPQRVATAPCGIERAASVEICTALHDCIARHESAPRYESGFGEQSFQHLRVREPPANLRDRFRNERRVPPAASELLVGAGVDDRHTAGAQHPRELAEHPAQHRPAVVR